MVVTEDIALKLATKKIIFWEINHNIIFIESKDCLKVIKQEIKIQRGSDYNLDWPGFTR